MIFAGSIKNKNITLINPEQVIDIKLEKGRTKAMVTGDTDGDILYIKDLYVAQPWSVRIRTAIDTYYINCDSLDKAIDMVALIYLDKDKTIKDRLEKIYGRE